MQGVCLISGLGADGDATGTVKVNNDTMTDLRKDKLCGFVPQDDIVAHGHFNQPCLART